MAALLLYIHVNALTADRSQTPGPLEPLILNDNGRKHYRPNLSDTAAFRPHIRIDEQAKARRGREASPTGRKHFSPEPTGDGRAASARPGLRQIPELSRRSGFDMPDPDLSLQRKRVVVADAATGAFAKDHVSGELTLERTFGVKHKLAEMRGVRNAIAQACPGDKLYHHVDYSPGFYREGGHVVGSTFVRDAARVGGSGGRRTFVCDAARVSAGGGGGSGRRTSVRDATRHASAGGGRPALDAGAGSEGTLGYALSFRQGACVPYAQRLLSAAHSGDIAAVRDLGAY
ncbi:hypothetical protein JKP88DRAFT_277930 [Tribonema minus]|uniref:Uncharacterized protein n=1 Tax=Tribonema minus TaxID=303371 RepID=A0A835YX95_9STRA|nr:hypothetical protein JKP88DRAFT_277930 [Tribonema minus]